MADASRITDERCKPHGLFRCVQCAASQPTTAQVQRFGLFWSADKERNGVMEEFDQGNWVKAEDYDALKRSLTACEKRLAELEPGAECWAALAACGRMKLMGCAGLHPESPVFNQPEGHIGLEFWTHHKASGDAQDIDGRVWFGRFMEKCLAAYRATGAKP